MNVENREFMRLMALAGWNQAKASRKLGVTPATVSRYVADLAKPSRVVLQRFADLIGEQVELPGATLAPIELMDASRRLEDWEGRLVRAIRDIEPDQREEVADAMVRLVESIRPKPKAPKNQPATRHPSPSPYDLISVEEVVGMVLEDKLREIRGEQTRPSSERLSELVAARMQSISDQRVGSKPGSTAGGEDG